MRSRTYHDPSMKLNGSKDFGALIRNTRKKLSWTQQDLASRVGVGRIWIINLEKGKPTVQFRLVLWTLKELGFEIHYSPGSTSHLQTKNPYPIDLNVILKRTLHPKK